MKIWGISCEKARFYAQKIIFFPILGGGRTCRVPPPPPPPESAPGVRVLVIIGLFKLFKQQIQIL